MATSKFLRRLFIGMFIGLLGAGITYSEQQKKSKNEEHRNWIIITGYVLMAVGLFYAFGLVDGAWILMSQLLDDISKSLST